jgi:hypothetical protein
MKHHLRLTEMQAAAVQSALDRLSAKAGRRFTLNSLLNTWANFVAEVERGYRGNIYEYADSLGVREVLDELCRSVPEHVRQTVECALRPIDDRYESATQPTDKPIVSSAGDRSLRWHRIPKILLRELRADLESEGGAP